MNAIEWKQGILILLDQTALPTAVKFIECDSYQMVAKAIKNLEVRGAPAIGAAAAFGMVLGLQELIRTQADIIEGFNRVAAELKATRPTAVNLAWAVDRILAAATPYLSSEPARLLAEVEAEAVRIFEEDRAMNKCLAQHGARLFTQPTAVLTHCNAGALATAGYGTALGVVRQAWADGHITRVFADETRPLLQGSRLTAWEMMQENIPVTLITDNMAGWVMKNKMVQAVIVGADRITANGDVANKIGTYGVAVLAKEHGIPFYVAAPVSTFDFTMASGDEIPIEERKAEEVTTLGGVITAPAGVEVFNPAFDVTPHDMVTAIITEHGVLQAPYTESIMKMKRKIEG